MKSNLRTWFVIELLDNKGSINDCYLLGNAAFDRVHGSISHKLYRIIFYNNKKPQ